LAVADDCSVIEEILTQNNLEITWNSSNSTGCCDYNGIECINGRVNRIDFQNKGLIGNIESIMQLTSLQYVNLSHCKFEGFIPSSIQSIYNLQFLLLASNHINGTIPREIAIPTLQFIDLSNNQLEGEIPSTISGVPNLQNINLSYNKLTGHIPSSFQNLKNIQEINLSGNEKLCGEIPYFTPTLKNCNFGSTLLCVSGSRDHCTKGLKNCDSVSCDGEVTKVSSEEPTPTNIPEQLTQEDYTQETDNNPWTKDKIMKWIAFGLIFISILCVIILILICMKKRFQEPVILEKPLPARKNNTIFGDDIISINDEEQDPDASIQIKTLTKPEQVVVPVVSDGVSHSQGSSYDESSQYELESSYPGSVVSNNLPINVGRTSIIAPIYNQGSFYATNSLGRNQTHQNGHYTTYSLGRNPTNYPFAQVPLKTMEQDLGELVIDNNGNVVTDNPYIHASATTVGNTSPVVPSSPSKKFSTSIFGYSHSQSSPNLVRMSHYSQSGNNKRRMTYSTVQGADNSANSSPNIESRRSKHASIPYLVSSYSKKSPNINNRKSYDTKRRSLEEGALHHNTIHVVNSRKSIPNTVEKSPTTITKITNYSENTVASNITNSVHSTTQLINKNKNRVSVHSVKLKRSSGVLSKYSQNSMNGSPLVTSIENCDLNPTEAEGVDLYHVNNNKSKSTLNPSIVSSINTSIHSHSNHDSNDDNDNNENVNTNVDVNTNTNVSVNANTNANSNENETHNKDTLNDTTPSNSPSIDYQGSSSNSNDDQDQNNQLDTPASIRNDNAYSNVNTNITTSLENTENPSEEIYIEDSVDEEKGMPKKEHSLSKEELYQQDALEEGYEYDYDYENLPDDIREQIQQPQPPNYEEVFSESMYTPYIDSNNDEAIRMQLEMRRLEERQLRMEYLQRQIDNPEISDAQRQKYIDALDRLMLE